MGERTVVRTVHGNSENFEVKVGMHRGSALSTLLFVIVISAIYSEFKDALPWELLYVDGLVVLAAVSYTHLTLPTIYSV